MSDKTKKTLIILASAVLVIGGSVWAYYEFTTVPPPVLEQSNSEEVVDFLGSTRGISRMPVSRRYDYLIKTYQHYSRGPHRDQFARRLRQMSHGQKNVLLDATFDIARVKFMDHARQYNKIRNKKQRAKFVDDAIRNFEGMRTELGGGGPNNDFGSPFRNDMPKSSDDWMKAAMERTNPRERTQAKPFLESVIGRVQELRQAQARR
jgi:hypothetical protein